MTYITRIANKRILAKCFLYSLHINYLHWKLSASRSIFSCYATYGSNREMDLTAIVLPKVTCDLPVSPVSFDSSWSHFSDLTLADPAFGLPWRIDFLLGVDIFLFVYCCMASGQDLLEHLLP